MALTTKANVKAFLGLTNATDDALLDRLIESASAFIENWLGRQVMAAPAIDHQSGSGKDVLILRDTPVISVESVTVNGVLLSQATDAAQTGWVVVDDWLVYQHGIWPRGRRNVVIECTVGFSSVPPDIEQAVIDLVALRYKERDRIGHRSKSLAGETVSYMINDLSDFSRSILGSYRRVVPA
ncbi:MAG: hypothetical protein RLY58_2309 [Pseudomonadota bacterium]|jgi:hypothetical protein